jgi:uncharacterized protein
VNDDSERTYRTQVQARGLVTFEVKVRETDLWIAAGRRLESEARDLVFAARQSLESYLNDRREILSALSPAADDPLAPPIVQEMIRASRSAGVGPMASVAGAIAERVGRGLLRYTDQVVVENGGDVFLSLGRSVTVGVFAGRSPLSRRIGLSIPQGEMPVGVCSSSGSIGHSLSLGRADAACVVGASTALADAAATALGNRVHVRSDLDKAASWAAGIAGLRGGVVILGKAMAAWGNVELVEL